MLRNEFCDNVAGVGVVQRPVGGSRIVPPSLKCKNNTHFFFLSTRGLGLCTSTPIICMFTFYNEIF